MEKQICVLCGEREATTKEHIPPRAIFPKPRPSDLITVPSCFECNNDSSKTDEAFKVHLGLHVWSDEAVIRTLNHNQRLRDEVVSNLKIATVLDSNDKVLGNVALGLWDSNAHSTTIEKCIRGLFFHHFGDILGKEATISTYYFKTLTPELVSISEGWANNAVGSGQLVYKYTSSSDGETHISVWLFQFFGAHWAGGQTKTILRK